MCKKTASKIIVPEKKELYFWECPKRAKNSSNNYSSGKKRNYIFGRVRNVQKKTASKIIVQEKRNYIFGRAPKPEKTQLPKL